MEAGVAGRVDRQGRSALDSLIQRLNAAGVRYLVIGGQAIRLHGLPRFSMDWDFFVPPRDDENFRKIGVALGTELDVAVEPLP